MKKRQDQSIFSEDDKNSLRRRILKSAYEVRARKRNQRFYAVAAILIVLIGISAFFRLREEEPSIEKFVIETTEYDLNKAEGVTLILGSGDNVNLDQENASVQYSDDGEKVSLGAGKTINQKSLDKDTPRFNTILVPYGKRTDLRLSDGTRVWLNSGSKLTYPAVFKGKTREVHLEGEAIFEVTHNENVPFKVRSKNQNITVLGTVFNVSSYSDDETVFTVLKSGSVKIDFTNSVSKSVMLVPGDMAKLELSSGKTTTNKVDVNDYFAWRDGFLRLNRSSLKSIMTKLSRYYNVDISIEDEGLSKETFSGNLDLKESIDQVLGLIQQTTEFEMESNDEKIIITNKTNLKQ